MAAVRTLPPPQHPYLHPHLHPSALSCFNSSQINITLVPLTRLDLTWLDLGLTRQRHYTILLKSHSQPSALTQPSPSALTLTPHSLLLTPCHPHPHPHPHAATLTLTVTLMHPNPHTLTLMHAHPHPHPLHPHDTLAPLPPDTLVVHVRSGDAFVYLPEAHTAVPRPPMGWHSYVISPQCIY